MNIHAAVLTAPANPFESVSPIHVLVLTFIAGLSGLLSLVMRLDTEYRKTPDIPRMGLFVVSHMLGAFVASILAFAVTQMNANGVWMQIIIVISASFTG